VLKGIANCGGTCRKWGFFLGKLLKGVIQRDWRELKSHCFLMGGVRKLRERINEFRQVKMGEEKEGGKLGWTKKAPVSEREKNEPLVWNLEGRTKRSPLQEK